MKIKNFLMAQKFSIVFLVLTLVLTCFVLYTPPAVNSNDTSQFSAIRAQQYIEVISRKPHSYYDRVEHEEVRLYLIETLETYLGNAHVFEYNYDVDDVKAQISAYNEASGLYNDPADVLYPVENILGVIPGENEAGIMLVAHYDSRGHVGRSGEMGRSFGAMDDGYGVSVMLEYVDLLKNSNPKNSIYFLFTDAEEVGLYGAIMAKEEPFMAHVKFMINLEARGGYGPSYMFETSPNNEKVIDLYKRANLPVSYSMATAVYSVMPNYTDFTPFIETGVPGINFAVLNGLSHYHTPFDAYEYIDVSSIQHMGAQIEPIINEFIHNERYIEEGFFDAHTNAIFFTILPGVLITYSYVFGVILAILIALMFVLITFLKYKENTLNKRILTKTLPQGLLLFGSLIVLSLLVSYLIAFIGKVPFSITYIRVGFADLPVLLLVLGMGLMMCFLFKKHADEILYLGIAVNVVLTLLTTFTLEGASFLFAFTAFFGMIGMLVDHVNKGWVRKILYGVSYAFIMLMVIPILYSFYLALTAGGLVVLSILLYLTGSVFIPLVFKQFKEV